MKQFIAGSIIDNLFDAFENKSPQKLAFKELAKWASYFQVTSKSGFENMPVKYPSNLAVLINLLQRGLPTKLNIYALNEIVKCSSVIQFADDNDSTINLQFTNKSEGIKELFFRSLHLIDPRQNRNTLRKSYLQTWERLGSNYEENFLYQDLPNAIGNSIKKEGDFIIQLLATQRPISNILRENPLFKNLQERVRNNFEEQRTDFSIEFPYHSDNQPKGLVIEVDGPHHVQSEQIYLDTERDQAIVSCNWNNTIRIKTSEFGSVQFNNKISNILIPVINNSYIKNCCKNYSEPLWSDPIGKEVMQLCLIPFGIARIQRTLIEAIACERVNRNKLTWKIAIIERDVPCAQLAIDDLLKLIEVINVLSKDPLILPKIDLHIFNSIEFDKSQFQKGECKFIQDFNSIEEYDLVIDISLLERIGNAINILSNSPEVICIRSIHYIESRRKTATSDLIFYKPFCVNHDNTGSWVISDEIIKENLEYLLQSIFRKQRFREGQLPILNNSLLCKSVIGLLPTGGGKSLTYQLSALLQPGICLVIDPIRSLMKDQVDGMLRNHIDSCIYINSTLQGEEKRRAMRMLAEGEIQFVFVSPERLQMEDFRTILEDMFLEDIFFSYCVIDEAHCVSEWGHDFRTAYLRLGENAIKYCKTKNLPFLPLFGLTATASYDVLADVQRELSGNNEARRLTEEAIIRSEFTKRNELQYIIEEVTFPTGALNNIWDLKRELGYRKHERVKRLLTQIPNTIAEFLDDPSMVFNDNDWDWDLAEHRNSGTFQKMQIENYIPEDFYKEKNAALIFCPHTKGIFGVTDKFKIDRAGMPVVREGYYDNLSRINEINAGYFMGSGNDADHIAKAIQEESFENQDRFINNELNLMVATKAFGMGIDKENIRYTIHINYPGSIESYVQEAGRAGRDQKIALSYILFNDQEVKLQTEEELVDHDLGINMYFHKNSFKGVSKELAVIDELLTEIYFPDRTFELETLINNEFDLNVKCNFWEGGNNKRLYINLNFNEPLGFLDLINLNSNIGGSVNVDLSTQIFQLLRNYIIALNLNEPVHLWIQRSDKQAGIEEILRSKRIGDTFNITVGFYNNAKERIKTITRWLHDVVHSGFTEAIVQRMRANCTEAVAFIEDVCENYQKFTRGQELDFENLCNTRDKIKDNPKGTAFRLFMALFNGYRDKMDTEKAIYRLSTIGIIDDYTVNFSSNTFTLHGKKKPDQEYKANLTGYLLKYYSEKTTKARLRKLDSIDEPTPIRRALYFLVNFVYNEIQKKRQLAIHDIKDACRLGIEKGNVELKDYIDLYFNSKYARTGYSYFNTNGEEVIASLPDITENGKNDDLKWVWLFMEIVEEDPKAGQIDNIKHLRGACTRMKKNQPDSYTLLLLNAFALYMLEFKNPRYLAEAETLIFSAFSSIQEKETDWNEKKLEKVFNEFTSKLIDKNTELESYMEKYGFSFEFDSIMITRLLKPLQQANTTLHTLNEILN